MSSGPKWQFAIDNVSLDLVKLAWSAPWDKLAARCSPVSQVREAKTTIDAWMNMNDTDNDMEE
ncbi:hypothetical protein C0995_004713 [Termitomyces sp. Mi166|nr:hypothetical protein C0995_004713 [Termitomyces sp. Mi166\